MNFFFPINFDKRGNVGEQQQQGKSNLNCFVIIKRLKLQFEGYHSLSLLKKI